MTYTFKLAKRIAMLRAAALAGLLGVATACNSTDQLGPTAASPTASPSTPAGLPGLAVTQVGSGLVFASFSMDVSLLNSTYTGTVRIPDPSSLPSLLSDARAQGGRVFIKLSGADRDYLNSDGTFNYTKWKSMVDRFRNVDFSAYVADGTIVAHFLIDEPNDSANWSGKEIPQTTVEAMAAYSKQLWPAMPTVVRAAPSWLDKSSAPYVYLDAAWAQYAARMGDPAAYITHEVGVAKQLGLRVVGGLNVLNGGTSESGIKGLTAGKYAMSASQLKSWGSAILAEPALCGFALWRYDAAYYGRSDIRASLEALSSAAKAHARVSCGGGSAPAPSPAPGPIPPPPDTTPPPVTTFSGVPFGPYGVPTTSMAPFSGGMRGADPTSVLATASAARQAGGRVVLRLAVGGLTNADGTFSLTNWKRAIDAYAGVDLSSYLADGTIAGHMLVLNPQDAASWGGQVISPATLDEMARYSRARWPALVTIVQAPPVWLAGSATPWQYLDAAAVLYSGSAGDAGAWAGRQATAATQARLGLVLGLNVLNGGTSSSGLPGLTAGKYAMSASQLGTWGAALLAQSQACGLLMARYDATYFGRSDVQGAVATLADKARAHAGTSCRVR